MCAPRSAKEEVKREITEFAAFMGSDSQQQHRQSPLNTDGFMLTQAEVSFGDGTPRRLLDSFANVKAAAAMRDDSPLTIPKDLLDTLGTKTDPSPARRSMAVTTTTNADDLLKEIFGTCHVASSMVRQPSPKQQQQQQRKPIIDENQPPPVDDKNEDDDDDEFMFGDDDDQDLHDALTQLESKRASTGMGTSSSAQHQIHHRQSHSTSSSSRNSQQAAEMVITSLPDNEDDDEFFDEPELDMMLSQMPTLPVATTTATTAPPTHRTSSLPVQHPSASASIQPIHAAFPQHSYPQQPPPAVRAPPRLPLKDRLFRTHRA